MVHSGVLRQKDCKFELSMSNLLRYFLKIGLEMPAHCRGPVASIPRTQKQKQKQCSSVKQKC